MKKALKIISVSLYTCVALTITVLSGCENLTPTRKPPLAEPLGFKVLNYKGWTTVGINEYTYKLYLEKLKIFRVMVDMVNEPALQAREQVVNWYNMALSAGAFGGIPLALRKVPKGYVKKEEAS